MSYPYSGVTAPVYRQDIEALRGIAILLVVAHHLHWPVTGNGYLGVDIFFVVSGYWMTAQIVTSDAVGSFTFRAFYARRIRRLFPSLLVVVAATGLLAPRLLDELQMQQFRASTVATLAFVGNVYFDATQNYFGPGSESIPLLHTWSLAIEEQFYLAFPMLLILARRNRLACVWALGLASFFACLLVTRHANQTAFYSLPTRIWELLAGSIAYLGFAWGLRARRYAAAAGTLGIVAIVALPHDMRHPGVFTLVPCVSTAAILAGDAPWFRGRAAHPLRFLGRISYSLYLVHWPAIVFVRALSQGVLDAAVTPVLAAVSILLALALTRYVEEPIRRGAARLPPRAIVAGLTAGCVILAMINVHAWITAPYPLQRLSADLRENRGLDDTCDDWGTVPYHPKTACTSGPDVQVALWGDSHAMHIARSIAQSLPPGVSLLQMTKSACAPLIGLAADHHRMDYDPGRCLEWNEAIASYLARHEEIGTVVVAGRLSGLVAPQATFVEDGRIVGYREGLITTHLYRTIDVLLAAGKRVVVVGPMPEAPFDLAKCLVRERARWSRGESACAIHLDAGAAYHEAESVTESARRLYPISVVSPIDALCQQGICEVVHSGRPLFRDASHLSAVGAEYLASHTRLWDPLRTVAPSRPAAHVTASSSSRPTGH